MVSNFAICIFCFDIADDTRYTQYGKELTDVLVADGYQNVYILTNKPSVFKDESFKVFSYNPTEYSYFDKLTICQRALQDFDNILYIDCDTRIDFNLLRSHEFSPGLSVNNYWQDGKLKKFEDMLQFETDYFDTIKDYCTVNKINLNDVPLFEERLFTISKTEETSQFFQICNDLRRLFEENDTKYCNYPVGRAEGLAMGIAATVSKVNFSVQNEQLRKLNVIHLPNIF
jgi:hypothetical protein